MSLQHALRQGVISVITWVARRVLSLRYRVKVQGWENVPSEGGALFLSNHPALVDPIILWSFVGGRFRLRPLVLQYFFLLPGVKAFMRLCRAFPIPDLSTGANTFKRYRVRQAALEIEQGLTRGERFLVYPSGRLKTTGEEAIGGASLVHQIVRDQPHTPIVLVRIEGLWGSRFSRALTGTRPELGVEIRRGIWNVLKNLLFFMPRRTVTITLELAASELAKTPGRLEFNRRLEAWYNQYSSQGEVLDQEPLHLVRELCWRRASRPCVAPKQACQVIDTRHLPAALKDAVREEIAALVHREPSEIRDDMHLSNDLGIDSLDIAQLVSFLEKEFDVAVTTPGHLETVAHIMAAAADIQVGEEEEEVVVTTWHQDVDARRPHAAAPVGRTLIEAWLNTCDRMGPSEAAGDERGGPRTYDQLKLGTLVLAQAIRALPGAHIGVMLPACVAVNVVVLACQLAGKTPVMLNWTMGPAPLAHAVELCNLQAVLSSVAFIDRLESVDLTPLHERMLLLEELVGEIPLRDLVRAKLLAKRKSSQILRHFRREQDTGQETAVILFTSGTESLPKGVPLTHANLLANQRAMVEIVELNRSDVMLGSIPPFHSFGFSVTSLLPMLMGVRVAFYPDPTNGRGMARACSNWQCSMVCAPPTFLKGLLHAGASNGLLRSLRLIVSGAEKAPDELFRTVQEQIPHATVLEGYGITECSPVIAVSPLSGQRVGVGLPIGNVRLMIVHPETFEPLPFGQQGLILVSGPSVFNGYLGEHTKDPFYMCEGLRWYVTGDLGTLDPAGYLTISGRLKRFVKIGGEMISLTALEQVLLQAAPADCPQPALALAAKEEAGSRTQLCAYSAFPLSLEQANTMLREAGFSNLTRLAKVQQLPSLPLLGSGKINYRGLPAF